MLSLQANRQDFDNLVWDLHDLASDELNHKFKRVSTVRLVEALAQRLFGVPASFVRPKGLVIGGYNALYRLRLERDLAEGDSCPRHSSDAGFDNGGPGDVLVRLPRSASHCFASEKIGPESATARFISKNVPIPVPQVLHCGHDDELGPFTIIEHVQFQADLRVALQDPSQSPEDTPVLNPNISEEALVKAYAIPARCLLLLSRPDFPRIGSLAETEESGFEVRRRPIPQNMSDMVQLANIPRAVLPPQDQTYGTADEWYAVLADMHVAQLVFQHNDVVSSEDDCRNKYVVRQIFRRLARQGRLSRFGFLEDDWSAQSKTRAPELAAPDGSGHFRLWNDDFRPVNILVDKSDSLASVIDWEFSYVAPTQFILDPPWWLLLEVPDMWAEGIEDYRTIYDKRLETWLSVMENVQRELENADEGNESTEGEEDNKASRSPFPFPLSRYMRDSWESGRFWLNYAARQSWALDTIFWMYLDERFFGARDPNVVECDLWKTRIGLLTGEEKEAMETFVKWKMEDVKERVVVNWEPDAAKQRMSELLFD